MRLPREISGQELATRLEKRGYAITRQTVSHLRLTTTLHGQHHITIPAHKSLKIGRQKGEIPGQDACQSLITGLQHADIKGRLWIVHRGRIREYQRDDRS